MRAISLALSLVMLLISQNAGAVKFTELKVIDKDCLLIGFRDGEIRYRDNGTGGMADMSLDDINAIIDDVRNGR